MKTYSLQRGRAFCSLPIGSVTVAMKAKRALTLAQVQCDVVKVSKANSSRGCIYGIEYPCELSGNVRHVLSDAGIDTLNI
jgi:hypothetical protein